MSIEELRIFLGWCTVINGTFLVLAFIAGAVCRDWVYRLHSKCFPMSREAFTIAMYCFIGGMKILFIMFNLVPYLALVLAG